MWTYRQSGFALQLLCELQKQQQSGLHCDTLLQTEGVSVPVHSCVLSALSPMFSRALTNSPPLPVGHQRVLSFQAVGNHSLLKLVRFIYSGEMEGDRPVELEEMIEIAHRLGFSALMDGLKQQMKGQEDKTTRLREIGLQTENTEERKQDSSVQMRSERSIMHALSQTVSPESQFTDTCTAHEVGLAGELASMLSNNSCTSAVGLAWMNDPAASSTVIESPVPVDSKGQQSQKLNKRGDVPENVDQLRKINHRLNQKLNVDGVHSEPNSGMLENVKGVGGKDYRKLVNKLGFSSRTAFEQLGDTQISLKIKLKKRGALWEIVSVQEESVAVGSSASGRGQVSPRKTHSHTENDAISTQPQKNGSEEPLSPSSTNSHQVLGTVTLTPPSDLTLSPPHTPVRNPPSPPLQMPPSSPGVPQAEESDEHIARLLEDMVMMGLNILPSVAMDKKCDLHHRSEKCATPKPPLGLKWGQDESISTSPAPLLCMDEQNLGAGGPDVVKIPSFSGSSAQGEAGSECPGSEKQSKRRTVELRNMTPVANHQTSLAAAKDVTPSFAVPCSDLEKVASFPFSTDGLELPCPNEGQLKNPLDKLFWAAGDCSSSVKRTKSSNSEENLHTSGKATRKAAHSALDRVHTVSQTTSNSVNSASEKPSPEVPSRKDSEDLPEDSSNVIQALLRQKSEFAYGTSSDCGTDLNEMRLPRCLSPLALDDVAIDGFSEKCTRPLGMSSAHSASILSLKPGLRCPVSPPASLPDKPSQQSPCTASVSSLGSSCLKLRQARNEGRLEQVAAQSKSFRKPVLKETKDRELARQTGGSEVKSVSTKRCSTVDEPNRIKPKMLDCNSNRGDAQTVDTMTTCSTDVEAAEGSSTAKERDCPFTMYWLRGGKTVRSESTGQRSKKKQKHFQTNRSQKSKAQDECIEDMGKKDCAVAKRGRGRPRKTEMGPAGLRNIKPGHKDSQKMESNANRECEVNKAQGYKIMSEVISQVNLKTTKQTRGRPNQAKRKSIDDQVFHQTIFSVGSTVTGHLPSIDQKLGSSLLNTETSDNSERKRKGGPSLQHVVKKFRKLFDEDERKLEIGKKEQNDTTGNGRMEEVGNKAGEGMDKSKDKNMDSETRERMETSELKTSKNGNEYLVDGNSEKDQMDKVENAFGSSVHPDSSSLKTVDPKADFDSHLDIVPFVGNFGSDSERENDLQEETKACLHTEETSESTEDVPLKECANAQIVRKEANLLCKKQLVEGNVEMGTHVQEILHQKNKDHGAESSDADVEMMEERSPVSAGCGDEAATSGCTDGTFKKKESQSGVEMINEETVAYEAEPREPLRLRTELQNISSSEVERGVNFETVDKECGDEEEEEEDVEVVDDILGTPGVEPYSLADRESVSTLTEEEEEPEEEEESEEEDVDVTGEDTD